MSHAICIPAWYFVKKDKSGYCQWVSEHSHGSESGQVCQRLVPNHFPLWWGYVLAFLMQILVFLRVWGTSFKSRELLKRIGNQKKSPSCQLFFTWTKLPSALVSSVSQLSELCTCTVCVGSMRSGAQIQAEHMILTKKSNIGLSPGD